MKRGRYVAPSSDWSFEARARGVKRLECGVLSGGQQFPSLNLGEEISEPRVFPACSRRKQHAWGCTPESACRKGVKPAATKHTSNIRAVERRIADARG
jgi:hypothetical protein